MGSEAAGVELARGSRPGASNDSPRYRSYDRNKSDLRIDPVANGYDAAVVGSRAIRRVQEYVQPFWEQYTSRL